MSTFMNTIRTHRKGALADQLNEEFAALLAAAVQHNKTGSLTLTVKAVPNGNNCFRFSTSITTKIPKQTIPEAIIFADEEGLVHQSDPNQSEMFDELSERRNQA